MKKEKSPRSHLRCLIRNWAVPIGCGLLFLFLLKFVFFLGFVPYASMEPTIREGSLIFGIRLFADLEYGDVIVFRHGGRLLVKRIAGIPGDMVSIISGEMLAVPDGCYFMLGDNTELSFDSLYWDEPFVPRGAVVALLPHIANHSLRRTEGRTQVICTGGRSLTYRCILRCVDKCKKILRKLSVGL